MEYAQLILGKILFHSTLNIIYSSVFAKIMSKISFHSIVWLLLTFVVYDVNLHPSFCKDKNNCKNPHGAGHPGYRGPGWQKCIKDGKWIPGCSAPGGAGDGFDFKIDVPVIKYKIEPKKRRRSNQWRRQQQAQAMAFAATPPRMPDHYYAMSGSNDGLASDAAFGAAPYTLPDSGQGQQWQNGPQVPSYSELLQMYWQARSQQPMQGPMGPPMSIPQGFGQAY